MLPPRPRHALTRDSGQLHNSKRSADDYCVFGRASRAVPEDFLCRQGSGVQLNATTTLKFGWAADGHRTLVIERGPTRQQRTQRTFASRLPRQTSASFGVPDFYSSRWTCQPFQPRPISNCMRSAPATPGSLCLPSLRRLPFRTRRRNPPCMLHPARPTFTSTLYPCVCPVLSASLDIILADFLLPFTPSLLDLSTAALHLTS